MLKGAIITGAPSAKFGGMNAELELGGPRVSRPRNDHPSGNAACMDATFRIFGAGPSKHYNDVVIIGLSAQDNGGVFIMRKMRIVFVGFLTIILLNTGSLAKDVSSYLILNNIGDYSFSTETKDFVTGRTRQKQGYSKRGTPGVLAGADHFDLDHDDTSYETTYINYPLGTIVEVQVTRHAGADSDRWLLHELESSFRDPSKLGENHSDATMIRELHGGRVFFFGGGIVAYRWLSDNIVVNIQYPNFGDSRPEPLDIVQAYLGKYPSTLPEDLQLDKIHNSRWIKREMERRLWLCDKWFLRSEERGIELEENLARIVDDHLDVFLTHRERYYEKDSSEDRATLFVWLSANDSDAVKKMLEEYKQWWEANRDRPIH